jgi:hypothetical protein
MELICGCKSQCFWIEQKHLDLDINFNFQPHTSRIVK